MLICRSGTEKIYCNLLRKYVIIKLIKFGGKMNKFCIITTACNKREIAEKIIDTLLNKKLVVCCQMMKIESSWWWKGEIEREPEFLIQMKTKKALFNEVEAEILKIHDYETCEIFAYDVEQGNEKFLKKKRRSRFILRRMSHF